MNDQRKKQLADLIEQLSTIEDDTSTLAQQERQYFDNAVMSLSEARDYLQQAMGS
jgi:hypothetical protein